MDMLCLQGDLVVSSVVALESIYHSDPEMSVDGKQVYPDMPPVGSFWKYNGTNTEGLIADLQLPQYLHIVYCGDFLVGAETEGGQEYYIHGYNLLRSYSPAEDDDEGVGLFALTLIPE